MTIYNLGSINVDHVYQLVCFPVEGETIPASDYDVGLGGKGANQSIAALNAGGSVIHIGSIGFENDWILRFFSDLGLNTSGIKQSKKATGHAVIYLNENGENTIVLHPGANYDLQLSDIRSSLSTSKSGDWFLLQNETNLGYEAAILAQKRGLKIAYSAAPFNSKKVQKIFPLCDLVVLNEVELKQCYSNIANFDDLTKKINLVITKGRAGVECRIKARSFTLPSFLVTPVDTTGAGDTFLGFLVAALDNRVEMETAIKVSLAAAALQITRKGAISAIPGKDAVTDFMMAYSLKK